MGRAMHHVLDASAALSHAVSVLICCSGASSSASGIMTVRTMEGTIDRIDRETPNDAVKFLGVVGLGVERDLRGSDRLTRCQMSTSPDALPV